MTTGIKPTNYQVQVKIFEAAGCTFVRTQGDHLIYHYPGAKRPIVIPKYKAVPVFIIKNNMKVIGLSPNKYLDLLQGLRPLINVQFWPRSRKAKISTAGIYGIFRGLKFESDKEIGQKGALIKGLGL